LSHFIIAIVLTFRGMPATKLLFDSFVKSFLKLIPTKAQILNLRIIVINLRVLLIYLI
jgi:hypothetical protein